MTAFPGLSTLAFLEGRYGIILAGCRKKTALAIGEKQALEHLIIVRSTIKKGTVGQENGHFCPIFRSRGNQLAKFIVY